MPHRGDAHCGRGLLPTADRRVVLAPASSGLGCRQHPSVGRLADWIHDSPRRYSRVGHRPPRRCRGPPCWRAGDGALFGGDDFVIATQGPATLRALTVAPVNVVLVDYPGSGTSSGRPTLLGIHQAAEAAYEWLVAQPELASPGVVVHGHSIGSFVAAALADVRPVRGLVLQNSATNPVDWMHAFFRPSRLKWWARPAYPFVRISIDSALAHEDNAGRLRRYRGPLLILSGTADDKAPPEMSRDLAAQSATPDSLKRLVVLPTAGHENVFSHPGFAPAYRTFITLVATAQGTPRSPAPANER